MTKQSLEKPDGTQLLCLWCGSFDGNESENTGNMEEKLPLCEDDDIYFFQTRQGRVAKLDGSRAVVLGPFWSVSKERGPRCQRQLFVAKLHPSRAQHSEPVCHSPSFLDH